MSIPARLAGPIRSLLGTRREGTAEGPAGRKSKRRNWLDQLPFVIFQLDGQNRWTFLSGEWKEVTGWLPSHSVGTPVAQFIHPQDRSHWDEHVKHAGHEAHAPSSVRLRLLTQEGKYRWVEVRARLHEQGGQEHILGSLTDVTDEVQADDLREAEYQNLVGLVHRLPAMLYRGRNNRDWTMYFVSEGAYKLTGFSPQELVNNRAITYGSLIHPEDQDKVWNEVQAALRERRSFEILYRIVTAQGHEKLVWERGQGVFSTGEDLLGIEGFITEAPQRLKRFTDRAEQARLYDDFHGQPTQSLLLDRLDFIIRTADWDGHSGFVFLLLGMANGDDLLAHMGNARLKELRHQFLQRLRDNLGETASLAVLNHLRIGVLLPERHAPWEVGALVDRIRLRCQNTYLVGGKRIDLDLNIGIAMSQSGWRSSEEVLENADQAMVQAGAIGGTREMVTDQGLRGEMIGFNRMAQAFQEALQKREIVLDFQPIFPQPDGSPTAWYGRLVWPQKRKAAIPLAEFLPAAVNRGLVPELKDHLCEELAYHLDEWAGAFLRESTHRLLLRLDAPELLDPDLLDRIQTLTRELAGADNPVLPAVPAAFFQEGRQAEGADAFREHLHQRNLRMVLDEFTGDFGHLAHLEAVEMVRLAPHWVHANKDRETVVQGICKGAEAFGLQIIAPEITDPKEAQRLKSLSCDFHEGTLCDSAAEA
ncbi:PAS domain-containing protein [Thiohalorhabdus methylotrophus]|uniref:PAS domain-containing protein n=1 Tax=Thiohalorhabdus methylotrophus TaxID=3242694 RepID=A0ABV4TV69_9GAMM